VRLAREALAAIEHAENVVAVSAVSGWEIETKRRRQELKVPDDLVGALETSDFESLSVTIKHAVAAAKLPLLHRDPFDRILVAQAQLEGLTIVTRDARIARYQVAILPA
jgi:PIN domain nuclease of toxin-antitoxin system